MLPHVATRSNVSITEMGAANRTFAPGIVATINNWTGTTPGTQRGKLAYSSNMANFTIRCVCHHH